MLRILILTVALCLFSCSKPTTYPGDKTEQRACRWCNGSGVESADAYDGAPPPGVQPGGPCVGCRGAKTLQVIIPGPNHPAQVKGTVRDKSKAQSVPIEALLMENHKPMQPVAGAIGGAKIRFEGPPGTIEIQSAPTGRFRVLLQPGRYKVHLEAAGYSAQDTQLDVAPRREPIWAEKARLVTPEGEEDITVADFLL